MIKLKKIETENVIKVDTVTNAVIKKGFSPYVGENGNWFEYDNDLKKFKDTGVKAQGKDGKTPVKGTDYFTNSDKEELKENILEEIEIPDVSNFITKTVNNLTNYYLKTETYTQSEVNQLISQITTASFRKVSVLPTTGETNIIYLVPSSKTTTNNIYDEYIYIDNSWEIIGSTQIDLTGYATEQWVESKGYLTQHQNIKTINNQELVGTGNIDIEAGKEVHTGTTEPTDDSVVWINPEGTPDTIPTKTSDLTNDSGFTTETDVKTIVNKAYIESLIDDGSEVSY